MKKLYLATLLLALSNSSFALDTPNYSRFDSKIQNTAYNADDVVQISAFVGMASQIHFAEDEEIESVYCGFSEGWEFETVKNNLFLKAKSAEGEGTDINGNAKTVVIPPNAKDWKTNLLVVTNKRNYSFLLLLKEGSDWGNTYRLDFDYPKEEQARAQAALLARQKAQRLKRLHDKKIKVRNSAYYMQVGEHSDIIRPSKVVDDGRFTYISFPQVSEIPAIFYVTDDGNEVMLNIHISEKDRNTLVVQRLAQQFVLRLDDAVVGITNKGFNRSIDTKDDGSTLEGARRVIKGGQR